MIKFDNYEVKSELMMEKKKTTFTEARKGGKGSGA